MGSVKTAAEPAPPDTEPRARDLAITDRQTQTGEAAARGIGAPLAVGLAAGVVAMAIAGAAFGADDGLAAVEALRGALIGAFSLAGAALVSQRVEPRLGALMLAGAGLAAGCALSNGVITAGAGGATLDGAEFVRALMLGLVPATGLHVLVSLPSGELPRRWTRRLVGAGYVAAIAVGFAVWGARPDVPRWPVAALIVTALLLGLPASHRNYAESRGVVRQRLQWVGLASALVVEVLLVALALRLLVDWPTRPLEVVLGTAILIPASFLTWVSRRLVGRVDRLLAHAVSFTGLSAVVVTVYVVVVLGLGRSPTDDERTLLLLSMVAAATSVVVFGPARARLAEATNRLVYGEQRAPDEALDTFGARLTRALPLDELLLQLAESLHRTMTLRACEVWKGSEGYLERAASVPDRGPGEIVLGEQEYPVVARAGVSGPAWASVWVPKVLEGRVEGAPVRIAPVTYSGQVLGLIVVERQLGDDEFSEEEDRVVTELARQLGLALHNSQLDSALQASLDQVRRQAMQLQESRARIVAAGDAERRKIERNLHDGAQQHLVALAVKLRLIQQVAEQDLEAAKAMLEEARGEVQDTIEELRTLAHGIYPPLLMDRGLAEALRAAAGRAVLPTTVAADGAGRYSQEIEAAVYFCCLEALQNAGKHAGEGATARVDIREEGGVLRFEIADDGVGFERSAMAGGAGFVNMGDRLGAMGGTVAVDSAPGHGTRVVGSIPIAG